MGEAMCEEYFLSCRGILPHAYSWCHVAAMKSTTEHLTFTIPGRRDSLNITPGVERIIATSGVRDGYRL
jgi:hypothetical protein